jgi:hypothetical protein
VLSRSGGPPSCAPVSPGPAPQAGLVGASRAVLQAVGSLHSGVASEPLSVASRTMNWAEVSAWQLTSQRLQVVSYWSACLLPNLGMAPSTMDSMIPSMKDLQSICGVW